MKKVKEKKYTGACWKCVSCTDYDNGICTLVNVRIKDMPHREFQKNVCIAYQPKPAKMGVFGLD